MDRRQPFSAVSTFAGPISWLGVFCLLGAFVFFWGDRQSNARPTEVAVPEIQVTDTPVKYQTADIKNFQIGERLLGKNPIAEEVDDFVPEIHPQEWRLLYLTLEKGNGKKLDMQFLRPVDWIKAHGAQRGATIDLDLPEFGAKGPAKVVSIEACPPIRSGKGSVVTGKFIHESDSNLIDLRIAGQQEATTVTANHRYWSADRLEFVEAGHLQPGEHVQTLAGLKQITSITSHPGNETVYNLEVQGEHVYLVGSLGTLVHNNYPGQRAILAISSRFSYGRKIANQSRNRGWTDGLIGDTVANFHVTRRAVNKATGGSATAYFRKDGSYIVLDDTTRDVIQVSDRLRRWIPDSTIANPYIP